MKCWFRNGFTRKVLLAVLACVFVLPLLSTSLQAQRRTLSSRPLAPESIKPLAPLTSQQNLKLSFSLPLRNQQELQEFLKQLNQPGSANYHHFLSAQEFTDRFGPTEADYEKVIAFAKANGMTVTRTYKNRMLVNVAAPVSTVNRVFQVQMLSYQHPSENRKFFAPSVTPTVDASVPILSVQGLTNYNLPHPMLSHASTSGVQSNSTGSGQGGSFLGSDMRAAYAPNVTLDGSGQTVGLIELGPYNLSDVQMYFQNIGQPLNVPIYNVLLDVDGVCSGTPATGGCDDGEEVIDIQQAISMAPHLSGLIVYEAYGSGSDALTAFTQAAADDVAKQLSLSFGWGGTPASEPGYEQIFMELAAQGQNVFVASGDSGANVGGIGYPGNSPNVVDVGGTDLTTNGAGGPWQSETTWIGSTGGWNTASSIPDYQKAAINGNNQGSTTYRNIPDVAMEANTDNYFCANGQCSGGIGGTSLAAPRWAGFLALVNEQANGAPISFLNPIVYALGQQSSYTALFHDITEGNDFNSSSPNLFSAVAGYDLTTGWGSPTGQALIDILAPVQVGAPNFMLASSPASLMLAPGASGTSTITVTGINGFGGAVDLSVAMIGNPSGVTATLSQNSVAGTGSVTLDVSTTQAAAGGNFLIGITGVSGGISHTTYVNVGLPFFTISASPASIYLNQSGTATSTIMVTPQNGFAQKVTLGILGSLPSGVTATLKRIDSLGSATLTLSASSSASTAVDIPLTIVANAGTTSVTAPSSVLAISAAVGGCGKGVAVDLSSTYNLHAIYSDGTTFSTGGLDGSGYAYSSNLLTSMRSLSGVRFQFGPANALDGVYGTGQTIPLPAGQFTALQLLATGIDGEQAGQPLTVTYTDGTTSQLTQSFSDWFSPSGNPSEMEAVAMPYRNKAGGTKDNRQFNLYGYTLILDRQKTVKSLTLPNNRAVVILAATLTEQNLGQPVNLTSAFNASGIYTDGTTFPSDGGLDGGGAAYSANLLGDVTGAANLVVNGVQFNLAPANTNNAVYGTGGAIALPQGHYRTLQLLGTGVQGNQTAQNLVITYTDGTTTTISQNFSDWFTPQSYSGESEALKVAYRDLFDGTQDRSTFHVYRYTLPLNSRKMIKSLTLPDNRNIVILAASLQRE